MAAGAAVIARRVGALPETVVHEETGILVDGRPPEVSRRRSRRSSVTRRAAREMGHAGRRARRRSSAPSARSTIVERVYQGSTPRRSVRVRSCSSSCRGWSSDAYWAARVTRELERRGHDVTLGCRAGTEAGGDRSRAARGRRGVVTFASRRVRPAADVADVRQLRAARLPTRTSCTCIAARSTGWPRWRIAGKQRPLVRTRHIAQAVRPHAGESLALSVDATAFVVTVTDAIRRSVRRRGARRAGARRRAAGRRRRRGVPSASAPIPTVRAGSARRPERRSSGWSRGCA